MKLTVVKGWNVKSTVFGFQQDAKIASYCPKEKGESICFERCVVSQKSKALRIRNQAICCSTSCLFASGMMVCVGGYLCEMYR